MGGNTKVQEVIAGADKRCRRWLALCKGFSVTVQCSQFIALQKPLQNCYFWTKLLNTRIVVWQSSDICNVLLSLTETAEVLCCSVLYSTNTSHNPGLQLHLSSTCSTSPRGCSHSWKTELHAHRPGFKVKHPLISQVIYVLRSTLEWITMSCQKPGFNSERANHYEAEFVGPQTQGPSQAPGNVHPSQTPRARGNFSERGPGRLAEAR